MTRSEHITLLDHDEPGFWERNAYHNYGEPMAGGTVLERLKWHVCTVVALRGETATARTIALRVPDWPGHVVGQRVDLRVTAADGYSAVREYSLASAPRADGRIELSVERLPDGEVSPYLTTDLAIGDVVELRGPIGGWFVWRDDQTGPIQLIAGGSGIVPLMSMIRSRAAARSAAPFRLLYSVRTPASVWYRNELLALSSGVGITYVYTRAAPANWPRPPGRIDATVVADASWPAIVSRHATSAARHRSSSTSLIFSLPRATVPSGSELSGLDPREIAHNTIEERVL